METSPLNKFIGKLNDSFLNANILCLITENTISMTHQQQCPTGAFVVLKVFRYSRSLLWIKIDFKV